MGVFDWFIIVISVMEFFMFNCFYIICYMIIIFDGGLFVSCWLCYVDGFGYMCIFVVYEKVVSMLNGDVFIIGCLLMVEFDFVLVGEVFFLELMICLNFCSSVVKGMWVVVIDIFGKFCYEFGYVDENLIVVVFSECVFSEYLFYFCEKGVFYVFVGFDGSDIEYVV